jgi:ASC-1-like (ASCH) protein
MNFKITCDEPWFSLLASGMKEVEGRKGLPKYRNLRPGDEIIFVDGVSKKEFLANVRIEGIIQAPFLAALGSYERTV